MAEASTERAAGYAAGILEIARAEGAVDRVSDELYRFARTFEGSDQLRTSLTDANLPTERRQAVVEELLGPRAHPVTTTVTSFLVASGRVRQLPEIVDTLVKRAAAERQREVAEVRAAIPLDADQLARLAQALSTNLGKQVEVKLIVDPSVMGGLVARVGDTVIDGTIRHRLDQLREAL